MLGFKFRKSPSVLTTFDLCLDCSRDCKRNGPPWCKLECSLSGNGARRRSHRILKMTDQELIARVAYG